MITAMRFLLLAVSLIFSCVFVSSFIWGIYLQWNYIIGVEFGSHERVFITALFFSSLVIICSTVISGTILGDYIASLFFPVRKMTIQEKKIISPALARIRSCYKDEFGLEINTKPYVSDMPYINGIAFGQRTIALSTGVLKTGNTQEIEAALAREIGHLHYRDGFFKLALIIAQLPIYVFHHFLKYLYVFLRKVFSLRNNGQDIVWGIKWTLFALGVSCLFLMWPFFFLWAVSFALIWTIKGLEKAVQWPIEYRADAFAAKLGYAKGMVSLFERTQGEDVRAQKGFLAKYLLYTHPPTAQRIDKLEAILQSS